MKTRVISVWLLLVLSSMSFGETSVAVVNIPEVSERYHRRTDLEARFELVRTDLNKNRDAMRDKISRAGRSLQEELKPGTDEYFQREKELAMYEAELQYFVESQGRRIERELAGSLKLIFDDIQAAVIDIAKQRGIDIVLAADQLPDAPPENTSQVRQQIVLQKVIYWHPNVDITDDVVAHLNQAYDAANKGGK